MKPRNRVATLAFAACVAFPASPAEAVDRKGFVIGLGAGIGHTRIEGESNTAVGSDFHIGGMLGDKTALLLEGYGVTDSEEGITTNPSVAAGTGDGNAAGVLRALAPGVTRVWADVRFADRRLVAQWSYRCCTGSTATTAASCPAQPLHCQDVAVDRIVVVQE